ncbi:MAG TPA: MobF family relaxase [Iamia sp.]|nr:MobF family relaxase [Iamia sp.]
MGADEVAYHQATVVGRADDHPGAALDYYGSRGETPLRWGGAGAARMGLHGEVTPEAYEAAFGPGGFRDPTTGERLAVTKRPGFELVVGAHKSVAVLGVIDRADDMHSILDVETDATMNWLDAWFQERGGRRGRAQVRTATGGLVYARTRHGTSRAGDPSPHDHVLVANVVEMLDDRGGHKGLDSAALRDTIEAATMVGRLHSAARAVELDFPIEPDDGPSGNLRHWRITGVPTEVCDLFSKRSDEIAAYLATTGHDGYRARSVAARESRAAKRDTGVDELMPQWRAELDSIGWSADRLVATLEGVRAQDRALPFPMTNGQVDTLAAEVLDSDGDLMARHKIFTRTRLISTVAPRLYGRDPAELDRVVDHILASQAVVPLLGAGALHEQAYATVEVLATEQAIADTVERLAVTTGPDLPAAEVERAVAAKEAEVSRPLTAGQYDAVTAVCSSGRSVDLVVGVAGSGKTTALDAATTALEDAGYRVVGTSTSGQAARTLGTEAHIESRTTTSLLWRLDHDQIALDDRSVVIIDEAAMTADAHLLRLLTEVEKARAKVVLVGDPRQLSAIGPGGAVASLLDRHPEILTTLDHNVRQRDPAERAALAELRHGDVHQAVDWYLARGRTALSSNRTEALAGMVEAWAADVDAGHDTALLAWRRDDVRDLNRLARDLHRDQLRDQGSPPGPELTAPGGRRYAVGDKVVLLAPNPDQRLVTSERLTVTDVDLPGARLRAVTTEGRPVVLSGEATDAEHLDHGYALTVHRAQGATYDRAHVLAAGGGRELAYVALSRARTGTTLHTVADDLDQARHDLGIDWTNDQHQRWITNTAIAAPQPSTPDMEPQPSPEQRRFAALGRLDALRDDLHDLYAGRGRWQHTPEGANARTRNEIRTAVDAAQRRAAHPDTRRRDRRTALREADALAPFLEAAEAGWQAVGQAAADDLRHTITRVEADIERDDVAQRRQYLASLLDRGTQEVSAVALDGPGRHTAYEGLGL